MRTLSPKHPKGQEPARGVRDDARLVLTIFRMLVDYFVRGRRIRRRFYACQRAGTKYFVDEAEPWP